MRTGFVAAASLVALGSTVSAQNASYVTGLASALSSAGLTTLAAAIGGLPTVGTLAQLLATGNHTVLAPSNEAFALLNITATTPPASLNSTFLTNTLEYHILNGLFPPSAFVNGTFEIARTALTNPAYVKLPGVNASQVVVAERFSPSNVSIIQSEQTPLIVGNATYQNLQIYVVNEVLAIPGDIASAAPGNYPVLNTLLTQFGLAPALNSIKGVTLFAPADAVLSAALSQLTTLNTSTATNVLLNHVINGTVGYSTQLVNGQNFTSASGEPLTIVKSANGTFVQSGAITARIVKPNILLQNGVLHIIDQVLLNTASNPTAAASAASVAASVGATQTYAPGAVAAPTINSSSPAATSSKAAGGANSKYESSAVLMAMGAVAGAAAFFL